MFRQQFGVLVVLLFTGMTVLSQVQGIGPPRRGERGYTPPPRQQGSAYIERPDVPLLVQEKATFYAQEIGLDAFQKEVLKTYLKDYYTKKTDIQFSKEILPQDKKGLIDVELATFKKQINDILSQEQVMKILTFEDLSPRQLKKEKKKKDKKKKSKKDN